MSRLSRRSCTFLALALMLGLMPGLARAAEAAPASPTSACPSRVATAGRIRVQMLVTGGTIDVHLAPTQVTGRKDRTVNYGATTEHLADGVRVKAPTGPVALVDTELIAVDLSRASDLVLKVDKPMTGAAIVVVSSATGYGTAVNLNATAVGTSFQVTIPRSRVFDPAFVLPKADSRKLVLAAYYPWFTATGWETMPVAERPLDPRSAWSSAGVLSMTQQAKANGVDGFVISWMGNEKNGSAYDVAATAATQTGSVVAPYIEISEAMNRGGLATVEQWLREALDHTGPASLTEAGVPVVFVWNMAVVSGSDWTAILSRLGRPVYIVGDGDTNVYGKAMPGFHTYLPPTDLTGAAERNGLRSAWYRGAAALDSTLKPRLHVVSVSPGFDDRILRGATRPVVSREGGRYGATWDAALAGDPDMVLITSWNEWYEGSEIEPGTRFGATALAETAARSAAWKSGSCTSG